MADENETSEEVEEEVKKGGNLGLIIALAAILIAVGGGLAVYQFVIVPKFAVVDTGDEPVAPINTIPDQPVNHTFDMATVNLMREGNESAGILLYQISFECTNDATIGFITTYEPRFIDMLNNLHASRTRNEVDDILQFKISVQRQAKQKANDMLQQMMTENYDVDIPMITGVFHVQCMATDGP